MLLGNFFPHNITINTSVHTSEMSKKHVCRYEHCKIDLTLKELAKGQRLVCLAAIYFKKLIQKASGFFLANLNLLRNKNRNK
jgi:hypothetical protein